MQCYARLTELGMRELSGFATIDNVLGLPRHYCVVTGGLIGRAWYIYTYIRRKKRPITCFTHHSSLNPLTSLLTPCTHLSTLPSSSTLVPPSFLSFSLSSLALHPLSRHVHRTEAAENSPRATTGSAVELSHIQYFSLFVRPAPRLSHCRPNNALCC